MRKPRFLDAHLVVLIALFALMPSNGSLLGRPICFDCEAFLGSFLLDSDDSILLTSNIDGASRRIVCLPVSCYAWGGQAL
jgi:hypothetical protein